MTALSEVFLQEGASQTTMAPEIVDRVQSRKIVSFAPGTRVFPAWHFAMLNDEDRNKAIERTISRLDLRGKSVFEIGTGCGIVALLFAKHGAEHVYTCEINPPMAEIARSVIDNSALADRISLLRMGSTEVIDRGLMPGRPDIIFTETLDCGVVGEGFHSVASDIRRIAGPGTLVIPGQIQQFGMLVEAAALTRLNRVSMACGFDITALNAYSTRTYFPVRERLYDYTPLSEPFLMHEYSYIEDRVMVASMASAYRSGSAHGVLSWFEAQFGHETVTNSPGTHGHWHQAFHPFDEPLEVSATQVITLDMEPSGHLIPRVSGPVRDSY